MGKILDFQTGKTISNTAEAETFENDLAPIWIAQISEEIDTYLDELERVAENRKQDLIVALAEVREVVKAEIERFK